MGEHDHMHLGIWPSTPHIYANRKLSSQRVSSQPQKSTVNDRKKISKTDMVTLSMCWCLYLLSYDFIIVY